MQRSDDQVAGLGQREHRIDRLQVAHLADHEDVGVLPQGGAQAAGEGLGVLAHLTLVDGPLAVTVDVLDRVLDREDVGEPGGADVVDHRGHRRRLARPGRAGDEDEPRRRLDHVLDGLGQAELVHRRDVGGDHPQGEGGRPPLGEGAAPHPGDVVEAEGEVDVAALDEGHPVVLVEEDVGDGLGVDRPEDGLVGDGVHLTVDADQRGGTGGEVQVGAAALPEIGEQQVQPLSGGRVGRHGLAHGATLNPSAETRIARIDEKSGCGGIVTSRRRGT